LELFYDDSTNDPVVEPEIIYIGSSYFTYDASLVESNREIPIIVRLTEIGDSERTNDFSVTLKFQMEENSPPFFLGEFEDVTVSAGESYIYYFPKYADSNVDDILTPTLSIIDE